MQPLWFLVSIYGKFLSTYAIPSTHEEQVHVADAGEELEERAV